MAPITTSTRSEAARAVAAILKRLHAEAAAAQRDNRAVDRASVHAPVQLGVLPDPEAPEPVRFKPLYNAWATDLSEAGFGFLTEHDLPTGVTIWADLGALAGEPLLVPFRIVYRMRLLPRTFRVGGVFV